MGIFIPSIITAKRARLFDFTWPKEATVKCFCCGPALLKALRSSGFLECDIREIRCNFLYYWGLKQLLVYSLHRKVQFWFRRIFDFWSLSQRSKGFQPCDWFPKNSSVMSCKIMCITQCKHVFLTKPVGYFMLRLKFWALSQNWIDLIGHLYGKPLKMKVKCLQACCCIIFLVTSP